MMLDALLLLHRNETTKQRRNTMYKSAITKNADNRFFALVVRVDYDGEEFVCSTYTGRHFKTEKAAIKSTSAYIAKLEA